MESPSRDSAFFASTHKTIEGRLYGLTEYRLRLHQFIINVLNLSVRYSCGEPIDLITSMCVCVCIQQYLMCHWQLVRKVSIASRFWRPWPRWSIPPRKCQRENGGNATMCLCVWYLYLLSLIVHAIKTLVCLFRYDRLRKSNIGRANTALLLLLIRVYRSFLSLQIICTVSSCG